ncbi:MAG TPA: magnesium/cobalt transporter CorA [Saprospiraceae bacterium]|nr:magnesium/cobalt transporter CorA [Saprospiraceae bacterium]
MKLPKSKNRKKNTGLAPGTIVFTGKRKVERIQIHYMEYREEHYTIQDLDNYTINDFHQPNPEMVQWYDIRGLHDPELIQGLGEVFRIHPLALEDIADTEQRPRMDEYVNGIFVTLKALNFDKEQRLLNPEHLSLYLTNEGTILTFQEDAEDLFASVRGRLEKSSGRIRKRKSDYLFYALMDTIVDDYYLVLEAMEEAMDDLEESILASASTDNRNDIYALRQELSQFRKFVFPLRELVKSLGLVEEGFFAEATEAYLRDLFDHVSHLLEMTDTYRDGLQSLQDLLLAELSFRTNNVMQMLTIISSIFIPLSFLAGVYGMNFTHMPELEYRYGYFILLGFMAVVVAFLLYYFKRKDWL